ncbi:MAG: hypothetical protein RR131_00775 [Anaerovorax sp.]
METKSTPTRICYKCHVEMEPMEAQFSYLDRIFRHKVLRCPQCGQVFIPEELATGRMHEVESALEEK